VEIAGIAELSDSGEATVDVWNLSSDREQSPWHYYGNIELSGNYYIIHFRFSAFWLTNTNPNHMLILYGPTTAPLSGPF